MKNRKFACALALLISLPILFSISCGSYWQEPLGVHPQPNAEDVRYYTTISLTLPKDYELIEIRTKPFVEIAHVGEHIMDSETIKFIGYPASILEYETTYNVNVEFKDSLGAIHRYGWKFSTFRHGSVGPEPDPEPKGHNVSTDAVITIFFHRFTGHRGAKTRQEWANVAELIMMPPVKIGQITAEEAGLAGTLLTFVPEKPLRPNTTYTAIYTTQAKEQCYVWEFTTVTE